MPYIKTKACIEGIFLMKKDDIKNGVSLFGQSEYLMDGDPLEEIFALNLGDFISEHLISEDLAKKISSSSKDKKEGLKNQLKELISIYSSQNTLCILSFDASEEHAIYTSIANTVKQMIDVICCRIYLQKDNRMMIVGSSDGNMGHELCVNFAGKDFTFDDEMTYVAMRTSSHIAGVIAVQTVDNKPLNKEYLKLVISISQLFAASMEMQVQIDEVNNLINDENASVADLQHLRAEITALIGDLCDYQQNFVEELAKAVDTKGQYTVSHSQNTANLARLICKELGLNEKTTDLIYYAGLLQNIGKITLPEKIFATNGKLSPEELKKVQEHINTGVNLLMNINFLSEVVPYVNYQTERYDGSGKPEGLKGQSIPLGSRIIAVADAFSAMTSDRPYRKAMTAPNAIEIMEADSKWDPVVINALKQVVK